MSRKLASVQRIWKIEPIEGADKVELAHILGWQCVVGKGQFKPMDLAIYFEIDSFLPVREEFEFLRKSSFKKSDILGEGFKLRTITLRKQLSQGLIMPLSAFPEIPADVESGTDLTELLGVRKWIIEERATSDGNIIGTLPGSIPHTDETRVQAMPELIRQFAGKEYYISTKLDGTSCSIGIDENGFHVTGHNYEYKNDDSSDFYKFVNKCGYQARLEDYLKRMGWNSIVLQGEFCAPGIQKNRLRLKKPEWFVFTIIIDGKRVDGKAMMLICDVLGIPHVPIEEFGNDLPSKYPTVEALLNRADGNYENAGKKEGIVIRTVEPEYCQMIGGYLSMKVVSNKYLLADEE